MNDLQGKVAVVTGAASGIGRAMAERFAEEGMRVVLADVEPEALTKAHREMSGDGADVTAVECDVSRDGEVRSLAERTLDAYGGVHVLCNNAGVGITGSSWELSKEDWEWVLGVNLWGVVHGIRHFVPIMRENGEPGHIVNTASMAGFTSIGLMAPYNVSKHGVVTLSECLHHELRQVGADIRVSVLCPGWVNTNIIDADRNRPAGPVPEEGRDAAAQAFRTAAREVIKGATLPREIADHVIRAVLEETFYILPHSDWMPAVETRMADIFDGREPTPNVIPLA